MDLMVDRSAGDVALRGRGGATDSPSFEAIEQQRAHEYVAEQVRRHIALGLIAPGNALPPERELVKMFGVGRVTIQKALGVLEAHGLVETRRGRSGGTFVLAPSTDGRALDYRMLEVMRESDQLIEALEHRRIVEPAATALAARQRRSADLKAMESALVKMEHASHDAEFMRQDAAFHLAIARATRNRYLVQALEQTRIRLNSALSLLPESDLWHDKSNREHRAIFEALQQRGPDRAQELMLRHSEQAEQSIRSLLNSLARTRKPRLAASGRARR